MAWEFITQVQLSRRISPDRLRRIYDDSLVGTADVDAVTQLRRDASSKVASYLVGITDLNAVQAAATADAAHEVVRLTLDVAVAMATQRFPEVVQTLDWEALMKQADKDLKMLRESFTQLDTELTPNPPANVGGTVYPDPDSTTRPHTFHQDGFGDF
jgi:hypothetical protein